MGRARPADQSGRVIADFFAALDAIPGWQLYAGVGLLLVLETTILIGVVTPGEIVLLAAATTVGTAGEYAALATVAAGASLVGQTGGYLLGRRFGGTIRSSRAGRTLGEHNWLRAEAVLRGGTGRAIVVSRFLAVAHSLVPVIAGTLRMPMQRFLRYTVLGAVVWGLVYVGLGSAASLAIRNAAHLVGPTATGIAVAVVVVLLAVRGIRKRREAAAAGVFTSSAALPVAAGADEPDAARR
jgi:membrane-associated protein